ncbi:MAG: hypothetical protein ACI31A_01245 [Candidatus Limisoma sp.]
MKNIIALTLVAALVSPLLTACRSRQKSVSVAASTDTVAVSTGSLSTAVDVADSSSQEMVVTRIEFYPPDSAGRSAVKAVSRTSLSSHRRYSGSALAEVVVVDSLRASTQSTRSEQVVVEPQRPLRLKIGLILVLILIILISWKIFKTLKNKTL